MRKAILFVALALMVGGGWEGCFAGVAKVSFKASKFAAKQSYHAAKHAAHYSVKAGKVAKKVLY